MALDPADLHDTEESGSGTLPLPSPQTKAAFGHCARQGAKRDHRPLRCFNADNRKPRLARLSLVELAGLAATSWVRSNSPRL